jgi:hypothetical protein
MRFFIVVIGGIIINAVVGIVWYLLDIVRHPKKEQNIWLYLTIKGDRIRIVLCFLISLIIINIIGWDKWS